MRTKKGEQRRIVEFIIGPCTREEAIRFSEDMQDYADVDFPHLGAAVAIDFAPVFREQDTKSAPTSDRGDE